MNIFRFKQFAVCQDGCAMKINTDGVLLGAMACGEQAKYIVDVGTGTGVIAMMMAQRYDTARLVAVELDALSADRAKHNVLGSPFVSRIEVVDRAFQDFVPLEGVDLLVSNPPFYTNSLRNPDQRKGQARHTDMQFFADLLFYAREYLSDKGAVELILPPLLARDVRIMATQYGLYLTCRTDISSFPDSDVIRQIVRFERQQPTSITERLFTIYQAKGEYSVEYREVLGPFFLDF